MSAHTPGPWKATKHTDTKGWTVSKGGGFSIASVRPRPEPEVTEANALLIAAAPTMLDVARAVVTAYGQLLLPTRVEAHLLDGALAAIAKAELGT